MADKLESLLASSDITDPTDFPPPAIAPGLRVFDDALRCSICREFYDAPVTLSCGHCFCSACIRSSLGEQGLCPSCRKTASETQLRRDVAMENAIKAWDVARPYILRLSKEEETRLSRPERGKRAQRPSQSSDRSSDAGRKRRRVESGSDDEVVLIGQLPPSSSGPSTPPDVLPGHVECPICQGNVPSDKINLHIDSGCRRYTSMGQASHAPPESKFTQKQQWSKMFSGGGAVSVKNKGKGKGRADIPEDMLDEDLEHLPKVAYDIHPRGRIADMLSEHGLPTNGDKNALIARHKMWVVLWNANVDRAPAHRKTADQLRRELRKQEDGPKAKKEAVPDVVAYQKANKAAFAALTEAARPKKTTTEATHAPNKASEGGRAGSDATQ